MRKTRNEARCLTPLEVVGARAVYRQAFAWAPAGFDAYLIPGKRDLSFRAVKPAEDAKKARAVVARGAIPLGRFTKECPSRDFVDILDDALFDLVNGKVTA